ncbi:hypothetical protein Tco_0949306, partial [Tanacetum coccineum]
GEEDASKQGRIADIDANEDIYLVNVQTDEDMFGVNDLDGDEVIVESVDVVNTAEETRSMVEEVTAVTILVSAATTTTTSTAIIDVEITLAQALAELKISAEGDDVTIDATPLSTKSPTIVDYKIYKEGKKSYFQIIRADVKSRFKKTKPVNYMDNFLLLNLKTMFEHHVEDNVWKNQEGLMFNDVKLQVDYECEIAFELLRLVKKQLKEDYVPE